jgi:hypothetical protein
MDDRTDANLALVERWAHTFNTDVEQLISELYAPDCRFLGVELGHERLLRFERRVLAAAPRRAMRVEQTHAVGDVVTVEAVLLDPDRGAEWALPFWCRADLARRQGRQRQHLHRHVALARGDLNRRPPRRPLR